MPERQVRPWQSLSSPKASDVAASFANPPAENCIAIWWGWTGPVTEEVISRDLDAMQKMNAKSFLIEAGYDMVHPYLSDGWFKTVAIAVEQAKRRGMRVWVEDEGKYPSGFAGGKFTAERPDLGMQALVVAQTIEPGPGEKVKARLSADAVGAIAVNLDDQSSQSLTIEDGTLDWTSPGSNWEIRVIEHQFKTSQTRSVNNPTKGKDETNSLCDYMSVEAVGQFIAWTHEQYKKYIGHEFGKTFLGFMSDEPDFLRVPWTPTLPDEFKRRKGYDVMPHLASFFAPRLTEQARRVKADYWDVWSAIFADSFFGQLGRWCTDNEVEYIAHLNCEDKMPTLVKSEGDFFRQMRGVHMPGVDTIWDQIWPGKVADFPKLASSAAHLYGRPRAFSESFAAYKPIPNVDQARWIMNYQMVRGINMFLVMYYACSVTTNEQPYPFFRDPDFPALVAYANRACYLLAQGRPAARIALYHPTTSMWLGDDQSNDSVLDISRQLMEAQRDFDFVGDDALASDLKLDGGHFVNASGQAYEAVVIPSITAISMKALARLKAFASAGGKVICLGRTPTVVFGKTFADALGPADVKWAICEPSGELTSRVLAALPAPDVRLGKPCPQLKYIHRAWQDADLYFIFNEGQEPLSVEVGLAGSGKPHLWDAATGIISKLDGRNDEGIASFSLNFAPRETKFVLLAR
jgi:hypothetical protein